MEGFRRTAAASMLFAVLTLSLAVPGCSRAPKSAEGGAAGTNFGRPSASTRSDRTSTRSDRASTRSSVSTGGARRTGPSEAPTADTAALTAELSSGDSGLALGNPSGATPDPAKRANYLLSRPQYAMSYNANEGRPNWVGWHVGRRDIGDQDRGKFQPDPALPSGYYRVTPRDYSNTGYDRGHCCPSKDRSRRRKDNDATFYMSNIMPQAAGNNQGPWKELEDYTRTLVRRGNEAYIVCGGSGRSGAIAGGKVSVPASTWKVIVILPDRPGDDAARVDERTRIIAVDMPNTDSIRERDWRTMRVRPADIERKTGLRLLSNVAGSVHDRLMDRLDTE